MFVLYVKKNLFSLSFVNYYYLNIDFIKGEIYLLATSEHVNHNLIE